MRFVKQKYLETIRPMDNETEFTCDSRYKISIFSNKFVVGTGLNAEQMAIDEENASIL